MHACCSPSAIRALAMLPDLAEVLTCLIAEPPLLVLETLLLLTCTLASVLLLINCNQSYTLYFIIFLM